MRNIEVLRYWHLHARRRFFKTRVKFAPAGTVRQANPLPPPYHLCSLSTLPKRHLTHNSHKMLRIVYWRRSWKSAYWTIWIWIMDWIPTRFTKNWNQRGNIDFGHNWFDWFSWRIPGIVFRIFVLSIFIGNNWLLILYEGHEGHFLDARVKELFM